MLFEHIPTFYIKPFLQNTLKQVQQRSIQLLISHHHQRQFFFWYKKDERANIERELRRIGRVDLIGKLYSGTGFANRHAVYDDKAIGSRPDYPQKSRKKKPNEKASFNPNFNHSGQRPNGSRKNRPADRRRNHRRDS